MSGCRIGADDLSVEIVKKALVWYYRAWSYYWGQTPITCVIHPAESFVEAAEEAVCLMPGGVSTEDLNRLTKSFAGKLTLIAGTLPPGCCGYCMQSQTCEGGSALLVRFLDQVSVEYESLKKAVSKGTGRERRRQEWRFQEAGGYSQFRDGETVRLKLEPDQGAPYTYTLIENRPGDVYFTESKSGPRGDITEQGAYRRHRHDVGRQPYGNLDLFTPDGNAMLWRLVRAGRGFKAFLRRFPSVAAS
jgi:hypothetical protein